MKKLINRTKSTLTDLLENLNIGRCTAEPTEKYAKGVEHLANALVLLYHCKEIEDLEIEEV